MLIAQQTSSWGVGGEFMPITAQHQIHARTRKERPKHSSRRRLQHLHCVLPITRERQVALIEEARAARTADDRAAGIPDAVSSSLSGREAMFRAEPEAK
jgi:hypothetical protein